MHLGRFADRPHGGGVRTLLIFDNYRAVSAAGVQLPNVTAVIERFEEELGHATVHRFSIALLLGTSYTSLLGGCATLIGRARGRPLSSGGREVPVVVMVSWHCERAPLFGTDANCLPTCTRAGTAPNIAMVTNFKNRFPNAPDFSFAHWLFIALPVCLVQMLFLWGFFALFYRIRPSLLRRGARPPAFIWQPKIIERLVTFVASASECSSRY